MSYCRFLEAEAYIYDDISYGIICCVCSLMPTSQTKASRFFPEETFINENFIAGYDYDKMLNHIAEHRAAGDYIPTHVDERLIQERDCDHVFIEESYGDRCEKCWRTKNIRRIAK